MKRIVIFILAALMLLTLCACAEEKKPTENPSEAEAGQTESTEQLNLEDLVLPITMKEQARLVVGEDSFDVKSVIELKGDHQASELGYTIASDDSVASVDENGVLTRKGYGQVSVSIFLKTNPAQFNIFNVTFAPENLYGATYKGGFKKADGTLGNEITLVLKEDKTFTLNVGAGQAKYLDADYDLDEKAVGEFTGTFEIDAASLTPVSLSSAEYSDESIKAAFGKTVDGDFCIRIRLNTVTVDGELKNVVIELIAQ
ncbi:MAG: hypothetical protein II062_00815 [Oscillospiraceae bacterium]|nr:hypothetical protein [Oscillospiraceae bacterium]